MADCPNCGRQTLRTKDWVCQWCGYPLMSKAFKVIDKTYKELEEERNRALKPTSAEDTDESTIEYEPRPRPKTKPPLKPIFAKTPPPPIPLPQSEPVMEETPPAESTPISQPDEALSPAAEASPQSESVEETPPVLESPPEPQPVDEEPPASEPVNEPEPSEEPPPESEPVAESEQTEETPPPPSDESEPEPEPVPQFTPPTATKPELDIEPEPLPEPTIKLVDIRDGMEITTEQIDTLFRMDKDKADTAFADKTLIIRGVVEKVFIKDQLDIRYAMITSAKKRMAWSLRCTFNKEELSKLSRLKEGEEVAVQATYEGYSKNIIFRDCVLV